MRIIAGPCQHENYDHSESIAVHCSNVCNAYGLDYYFKASYDKANRSSAGSMRGIGIDNTLIDFMRLKDNWSIKTLTDVHSVTDIDIIVDNYNQTLDVIQIPAFLSRQSDLIAAAVSTDKIVNIKKGQWMAPWDVKGVLSKSGTDNVWITDRGTSFGYNTLVVDFTGIRYMLDNYNVPVVIDCTHGVQRPGGNGDVSGGNREYAPYLAYAGVAVGVDNFFLEVHDDPDNAPSDGPNMIKLDDFEKVIEKIVAIKEAL